ncbi:MAG TPA: efflux RND transporter periplasmic adaptor subunit [Spongiibacteraceae bacterium]|nr:efflux RND transporter periplasmic adaptor subunit [Spongiibacteraceae bacterium]
MNTANQQAARRQRRTFVIVAVVIVAAVLLGIAGRMQAQTALRRATDEAAIAVVATVKPTQDNAAEEVILPGNVQAFADAPIYARTSGYLKRWLVDIGEKVKKGQLIAEIDAPEVDQQLLQAQADLASAEANNRLAQSTAQRWTEMLSTDSVSKQDVDEKVGDAAAKQSALQSARANSQRLRELQGFKRIEAPFSGVITARNIDIGALVDAGTGRELFRIAASDKLRVYIQAPQNYAAFIKVGMPADVQFADRPGKAYRGKLARTADAIDPTSRTLLAQIELDNASGELLAGSYAEVHLQFGGARGLRLPVNALIFRAEGLQVATVGADKRITLKNIELGRDYGTEVEVIKGLNSDDAVVLNPPDALFDKQLVQLAEPNPEPAAK